MTILDKYLVTQTLRLLLVATGIVFLPLILERLLRLFEFAAEKSVGIGVVLQMAVNLVPHYLGLALPAAFFVSILLTIARMGDENELDVVRATGQSIRRTARPVVLLGFALSIFAVLLLGYIQPFSRYAYGAIRHAASYAIWTQGISPSQFFVPSNELAIYADKINLEGQGLSGVFIYETNAFGSETSVRAGSGYVKTDPETNMSTVVLTDATIINAEEGRAPFVLKIGSVVYTPDESFQPPAFRPRGRAEREMTLGELWAKQREEAAAEGGGDKQQLAELNAEATGRLIRSISIAAMPFLAIPIGIAAKRKNQGTAIAIGSLFLVTYHYSVEMGQGLVAHGTVSPLLGMWTPMILFMSLCVYLFYRVDRQPRSNPWEVAIDRVSEVLHSTAKKLHFGNAVPK